MKSGPLVRLFLLAALSLVSSIAMAGDIIDLPPSGTDVSNLRAPGGIISTGDALGDVEKKCGRPLARGQMPNRKYDVWVYRFADGTFVHYLGFRNQRLERIYSVSCVKNDPFCK